MENKEIEITIRSPLLYLLILSMVVFFYFELKVVLPNPISFGDEGFHTSMARYIALNKEYPKYIPFEGTNLVRDGFYRPPFWNILTASFFFIFGVSEFLAKILTLIITFFLGLSTYLLVRRISDELTAFLTAILLVSFQSVLTYTVLFYYADLLLFFVTLSFFSFLVFVKEGNKKFLFLSSAFASLALLTNQFALTLYAIYFLYFLYEFLSEKNYLKTIKTYLPAFILLLLIPSGYIVRNIFAYNSPICFSIPIVGKVFDTSNCKIDKFEEKFKFAGQAIPIGTEATAFSIGLMSYLEFAYANTLYTILPFLAGLVLFYLKRDKSSILIFITLLLFIILLAEIGKGRAEDTARYTLGFASFVAFVSAAFYKEFYEFIKKYQKHLAYILIFFVLAFSFLTAKSRLDTLYQVKKWDESFFVACEWIKENTPKNSTIATIWGHNAAWCSDRNLGGAFPDVLLSYDLNYTLKVLKENNVDYIWVQKGSIDPLNRGYADNYPIKFISMLVNNPKHFEKVYENGDKIENCSTSCYGQTIYKIIY